MAEIRRIKQMIDGNGNYVLGLNFPEFIDNLVLIPNTAKTYTIPENTKIINIVSTGDFWVAADVDASIPDADIIDGSGSLLNPAVLSVSEITALSFISSSACKISISVYI